VTTKMVRINEGVHGGQLAYVTYDVPGDDFIRATPVGGDPMVSVEFHRDQVEYIWGASRGPIRGV
jgi:hypothetical protein